MLSLETCMRLKEAGWDQEEHQESHGWYEYKGKQVWLADGDWLANEYDYRRICACPSLDELLEAIVADGGFPNLVYLDKFKLWFIDDESGMDYHVEDGFAKPVEAAAALWLKRKGPNGSHV